MWELRHFEDGQVPDPAEVRVWTQHGGLDEGQPTSEAAGETPPGTSHGKRCQPSTRRERSSSTMSRWVRVRGRVPSLRPNRSSLGGYLSRYLQALFPIALNYIYLR